MLEGESMGEEGEEFCLASSRMRLTPPALGCGAEGESQKYDPRSGEPAIRGLALFLLAPAGDSKGNDCIDELVEAEFS